MAAAPAPKQGQNFAGGYVPRRGDVVHVDWSPVIGHEMEGPHYGLVLTPYEFNFATGLMIAAPITSKAGKLSNFELPIQAGKVKGAVILSALRSLDFTTRDTRFEAVAPTQVIDEGNRRVRLVFP
jgi:mRNA-degrading endonuclease toxin of MazEF toxin-antitoxin module